MPTTTIRPALVHVRVAVTDLRAALGADGQPATLVFTSLTLTVVTPAAGIRIPVTALAQRSPGIHQLGLRPRDADRLRATSSDAIFADIVLTATTLTITTPAATVTVGRW